MSDVDGLYTAIVELLDMAVFALDVGKRFVRISQGIEQIIGFRPDELAGTPLLAYIRPEDRSHVDAFLNVEPSSVLRCEAGIIGKDSSVVRCIILHQWKVNGGHAFSIGIIGRATVSAAEAEEKLKVFSMVVEQSPATVVITDRHGTIEYVNPKFSSLTGYSPDEAVGRNPRILKSGIQPPEFYRLMWETISSGREWQGEFHNKKKNGDSYWESASISPILGGAGEITHYVAIKEDITERKRAEEALRASEKELRDRNNEMEEELKYAQIVVERLLPDTPPAAGNLKIDFRYNPLTAIGGDYFSFNTLHEGCLGVFVGDVPGHGVSAALYLSLVRSLTNRLNWVCGTDPALYMKTLNEELLQSKELMFLSALYGYFDFPGDRTEFHFAKGGHPPPVVYRAADSTALLLHSGGTLVGISPISEFEEVHITLAQGDRIYLYTDGIIESRNARNVMLDIEGLEAIIAGSGSLGLSETLDHVIGEARRFRDSKPMEDDLVIVGFEAL
jgi:sigma-B regulation protein RsbU (phosphoserine phosphatase)